MDGDCSVQEGFFVEILLHFNRRLDVVMIVGEVFGFVYFFHKTENRTVDLKAVINLRVICSKDTFYLMCLSRCVLCINHRPSMLKKGVCIENFEVPSAISPEQHKQVMRNDNHRFEFLRTRITAGGT